VRLSRQQNALLAPQTTAKLTYLLTEISPKLYYLNNMLLPDSVQQIIEHIINATEDVTPQLRQPMADELHEQFEALMAQTIIKNLPQDRANAFKQLLDQDQATVEQVRQFLDSNISDMDAIINQAADRLNQLYLG
jgi:putative cell wall-binding protein